MGPPVLVMWLFQNLSTMVLATRAQNAAQRSSSEAIRRVVGRKAKRKEKAMDKMMRILVPCLAMIEGFGNFGVWSEVVQMWERSGEPVSMLFKTYFGKCTLGVYLSCFFLANDHARPMRFPYFPCQVHHKVRHQQLQAVAGWKCRQEMDW